MGLQLGRRRVTRHGILLLVRVGPRPHRSSGPHAASRSHWSTRQPSTSQSTGVRRSWRGESACALPRGAPHGAGKPARNAVARSVSCSASAVRAVPFQVRRRTSLVARSNDSFTRADMTFVPTTGTDVSLSQVWRGCLHVTAGIPHRPCVRVQQLRMLGAQSRRRIRSGLPVGSHRATVYRPLTDLPLRACIPHHAHARVSVCGKSGAERCVR